MKMLSALFLLWAAFSFLSAQEIRPIRDSVGYCWEIESMHHLVGYVDTTEAPTSPKREFIAGISPHDDYLYAARIYYPLFRSIKPREVVIFGVTHSTVRKEIGDPQGILLLDDHKSWMGCGKTVEVSPLGEFIKNTLDTQYYRVNNHAHELEHSIEATVPWLQMYMPDVRITPIMVTRMSFDRMEEVSQSLSDVLAEYIRSRHLIPGPDIFFLCSSDANHYGKDFQNTPFGEDDAAHTQGIEQDQKIAQTFLAGKIDSEKLRSFTVEMQKVVWCGKYSIPFGLLTAQKTMERTFGKSLKGTILRYSDSYSAGVLPLTKTGMGLTAPFSLKHWVGYLSAGFTIE